MEPDISKNEVYKSIHSTQWHAVGYDGIHLKFNKLISLFVLVTITHIFKHVITTNIFTDARKIGKIIPVAKKKSSPVKPNDYIAISIL